MMTRKELKKCARARTLNGIAEHKRSAKKAEMKKIVCPACGQKVFDTGRRSTDDRLILSCGDAVTALGVRTKRTILAYRNLYSKHCTMFSKVCSAHTSLFKALSSGVLTDEHIQELTLSTKAYAKSHGLFVKALIARDKLFNYPELASNKK